MSDILVLAVGAAVLGAIVGSFLGAALVRLPAGRSVVAGRSACDHCGTALAVQDLVPLLSFALLRGRCRTCGGAIGWWQLACELGGAGIALAAVLMAPAGQALAAMALGWQLLLLALLDLRHLWLPRALTAVLAAGGLAAAAAATLAWRDPLPLALAAAGGGLGWALLALVAFAYARVRGREGLGGGDPPLLSAIGCWLGPAGVLPVVLAGALIGLAAALLLALAGRSIRADTALPLGTCLAAAAWPLFLWHGFGWI